MPALAFWFLLDMHDVVPITLLAAGQTARVHEVLGDTETVHRLEEMGLRGGATIEVLQSGTPCIIRLGEHRLCFRGGEMSGVLVEPGVAP